MADLSRKTVLIYDASGSYTHCAEVLVGAFGRVLYHSPWESGFAVPIPAMPGTGLDGVERCDEFFDALDETDLVVFTDVGHCDLQEWLRRQGMPVFGSGAGGKLEQDRVLLKSVCQRANIDCADHASIRGIDALREFLEREPGELYIKLSYFRGLTETEHFESMLESRPWLDKLSLDAGPYVPEFLLERPIDEKPCIEVGIDTFCAGGEFPSTIMWGYEADKDNCYVGTIGPLPERLQRLVGRLGPILRGYDYRGPLSTETRETEDKSYLIDLTCRMPEPPSSLKRFMVTNSAEVWWEAAHGRVVEEEFAAPVGVQIVWKSIDGQEHPLAVNVGRMDRVTIHGHCVFDGQHYAVSPPKLEEMGGACGLGDTAAEALRDAIDAADSICGRGVHYDSGALEKIAEAIQQGRELGLGW